MAVHSIYVTSNNAPNTLVKVARDTIGCALTLHLEHEAENYIKPYIL